MGKKKIECTICGDVHFVPVYIKDFVCKNCTERDEFDNEGFTSPSWNYKTITKEEDVSQDVYMEVD